MSRYRGPRLKKIRRLGALPGLTRKTPKSGSNLKKIQFWEKGAISYLSSRQTEIAFSLWSDRGTASTAYPGKSGLRLRKALVVIPSWAPW